MIQNSAEDLKYFSHSKLIFFERVKLLYDHLLVSLPIGFACAAIIYFSLYGTINKLLLGCWFGSALFIFVIRLLSFVYYKRKAVGALESQKYLTIFTIGTTLTALLWSTAGTILMPVNDILLQAIIIVIIAGVTAGSVQSIQASRFASSVYIILSIFPLAIWLVSRGTAEYTLLALAVVSYMVFMLAMSRKGFEIILNTLKLRYENSAINAQLEEINKQLHEELQKQKEYETSLAQLAEIVNHSKDAIIGLDFSGTVKTWNKGAHNLYGYSAKEMIGKNIEILTPENRREDFQMMFNTIKNNSSLQNIEIERITKDQSHILVEATLSPIKNKGKMIGISTIERNIQERKEIDRVKNEFISLVSHELRTPLTSIKRSLGLLLHQPNERLQNASKLIEIAYNNCNRLINLVNDILDIEKIESGIQNFDFKTVNILNIIEESIEQIKAYADKHKIEIIVENPIQAYVKADTARLIQVFYNLLSNAIKFSPPHKNILVRLKLINNNVQISIIDQGLGIPEEFKDKIFDRFTQANTSSVRAKGGSGLGLSISKAIMEKHGSELKFTSQLGHGTSFYFELPLVENTPLNNNSSSKKLETNSI